MIDHRDSTAEKVARYLKRGWCPVPWAHHPPHIKAAIRQARMVPKLKGCFENSQRLVLRDYAGAFTYVEGWVCSRALPIPIQHAWIMDADGQYHDLTMTPDTPKVLVDWTVPQQDLRRTLLMRGFYGPIDETRFQQTYEEAFLALGVDLSKLHAVSAGKIALQIPSEKPPDLVSLTK